MISQNKSIYFTYINTYIRLNNWNYPLSHTFFSIPSKSFFSTKNNKVSLRPSTVKGTLQNKEGGDLLSRIALQYHRRRRA
ncbi:hypothetical protein, partial [Prevotella koreensis]